MCGEIESLAAVALHRRLQPPDFCRTKRHDDVVGHLLGHIDEREAVRDFNCADRARLDARYAGDRADEIAGPNPRSSPGAHEETRHAARVVAAGRNETPPRGFEWPRLTARSS